MKPYWTLNGSSLYQGHVLDVLKGLDEGSVQCIVTSPPYYGLRSYGLPPIEWPAVRYAPMAGLAEIEVPGCAEGCEHVWTSEKRMLHTGSSASEKEKSNGGAFHGDQSTDDQWCQLCGGWRGCLGLEPTVEMFVGHLVLVWRELWRVLREDGCCWLNLGDSYSSQGGPEPAQTKWQLSGASDTQNAGNSRKVANGLKPKDLIGIPWRVALALQADGWYLRSDIVWAKGVSFCPTYSGSCMPESVRDRPTKAHENVFLLSKQARYYYDADAVREASANTGGGDWSQATHAARRATIGGGDVSGRPEDGQGRNLRTVWLINPGSYAGAHFATFPSALVSPMIRAGSSERGACPNCGAAWERVTTKTPNNDGYPNGPGGQKARDSRGNGASSKSTLADVARYDTTTTGWTPTCSCGLPEGAQPDDFEIIHSPTGTRAGDDPTMQTGRAGYNRPRGENEGSRPITRYEQRHYAAQLKDSPYREQMEVEAGTAFEHYVRTDKSGARPVPDSLLSSWIERGWLNRVDVPEWTPFEPTPCTVLDPFGGSGTTADVARQLRRRWILIELSQAYCDEHIIPRLEEPLMEWAEQEEDLELELGAAMIQLGLL